MLSTEKLKVEADNILCRDPPSDLKGGHRSYMALPVAT